MKISSLRHVHVANSFMKTNMLRQYDIACYFLGNKNDSAYFIAIWFKGIQTNFEKSSKMGIRKKKFIIEDLFSSLRHGCSKGCLRVFQGYFKCVLL